MVFPLTGDLPARGDLPSLPWARSSRAAERAVSSTSSAPGVAGRPCQSAHAPPRRTGNWSTDLLGLSARCRRRPLSSPTRAPPASPRWGAGPGLARGGRSLALHGCRGRSETKPRLPAGPFSSRRGPPTPSEPLGRFQPRLAGEGRSVPRTTSAHGRSAAETKTLPGAGRGRSSSSPLRATGSGTWKKKPEAPASPNCPKASPSSPAQRRGKDPAGGIPPPPCHTPAIPASAPLTTASEHVEQTR